MSGWNEWRKGVDKKLDSLDSQVNILGAKVSNLENGMASLNKKMTGLTVTVFSCCALMIAVATLFTTWLIIDSNRNWDRGQQALDKIHNIDLRLERSEAETRALFDKISSKIDRLDNAD